MDKKKFFLIYKQDKFHFYKHYKKIYILYVWSVEIKKTEYLKQIIKKNLRILCLYDHNNDKIKVYKNNKMKIKG